MVVESLKNLSPPSESDAGVGHQRNWSCVERPVAKIVYVDLQNGRLHQVATFKDSTHGIGGVDCTAHNEVLSTSQDVRFAHGEEQKRKREVEGTNQKAWRAQFQIDSLARRPGTLRCQILFSGDWT